MAPSSATGPLGAEAVRRAFRRILSGDDEGQPPWVRALGEPGDAGWFGPGSTIWQVNGSLATLVGGVRALLLQACHPLALAGVEEHSTYRQDPLGRLQRTNLFVTTVTFGSSRQAAAVANMVQQVHRSVSGIAPDGRPYSASDPRLLLWVHLALTDSMLVAAQRFLAQPVDADAYVSQMARVGEAVGVLGAPRSHRELLDAFESFRDELAGGQQAELVSRFLRFPGTALPVAAWAPYSVLSRAATDLLPNWAHHVLHTADRSAVTRTVNTATCSTMLRALQAVLGPYSMATKLSYQRLGLDADDWRLVNG